MPTRGQLTGMRGVYLVAAELSRQGLIASPTSRSAIGADILATDLMCSKSFSVQVKTNAQTFGFWLLNEKTKDIVSSTHIYVFVNLRTKKGVDENEFFVVDSAFVAKNTVLYNAKTGSKWWAIYRTILLPYRDKWDAFKTSYA